LASWRGSIGYVSQEPFLLNASILDNIRFFNQSIKEDDVKNFAKEAGIGEFIESLPMGYQTMVGERGVLLSGGQRQRIALARVLSRKPKLLILDEATSSLDAESEATIQSAIEKIRGMITVIIIAHRPGTLLLADKIVVLDQGHITEEGSPRDLLSDKDSYLSRVVNLASLN
jgi:ATP-binding cassette subfamily C protein